MNEAFNITSLFIDAAKKNPQKTAIVFRDKKISFAEFEKQIDQTAQYFLSKGISKGDKVLIFIPMSINLYRIVLALFKIGAVAVFFDEWVSKKRMDECCKVAKCKVFIGILKARILSNFSTELRKIPLKLGTNFKSVKQYEKPAVTGSDNIALITFTTGSTGIPKASIRTHGLLYNQFKALRNKINAEENEVSMAVLPIVLLINLATGTTSVIASFKASKPASLKPEKIINQIKDHSINSLIASPFFIKELSLYVIDNKISLPKIKKIFTGGAPVFPNEAKLYKQAFPSAAIEVVYGSTEAEPISSITTEVLVEEENYVQQGLKAGKIDESAAVKIIQIIDGVIPVASDEDLRNIELPPKEIGEIIVSGNHVLRQYLNNEAAVKRNKIFIEKTCWHRTGDSGYLDSSGTLFLMGRCNTIIRKDHASYYPFLFENYFQTLNGVEMGTIFLLKNKVTAVIELKDKMKQAFVTNEILKKNNPSENGKVEEVLFIKKIPRDPRHNSKIDYQKLILSFKKKLE